MRDGERTIIGSYKNNKQNTHTSSKTHQEENREGITSTIIIIRLKNNYNKD